MQLLKSLVKELNLLRFFYKDDIRTDFTGALVDNRPEEEKKDDIHFKDIVASANAVVWKEKKEWRTFPKLDQWQSFMCGANVLAKAMGVSFFLKFGTYINFSRADIYQRRFNRPSPGMTLADLFRIASEGVTLEQLTPKEIYTDADADTLLIESYKRKVGEVFSVSGGVYLPSDMETMASVIQTTEKAIILLTFFNSKEWSREYPLVIDTKLKVTDGLRHFVAAVDFGLVNGKKHLKIEDSAKFGGLYERKLDEEWVSRRVYGAGYLMNFKFQVGVGDRPTYDGMTIISTQKCLRFEGLFPINIDYFENLGPSTRIAIKAFQKKYSLAETSQLDAGTQNKLRQLFP